MANSQKNQALRQKVKELEKQATEEQQEVATWIAKVKHHNEVKTLKERQLQDQELQIVNVNYSYLQHQYKYLLQRHSLLLSAFTDVKSVTFEEYISAEADKATQNQIKAFREITENRMEVLQSKIKELLAESASAKENNASLSNFISTKVEEIGKLEACVSTLTTDAKKSSAEIQELETTRDALDRALQESKQSLNVKAKVMSEMQSQYNMEKKRLEDELCAFRKANEMLSEKLKKEEEERATLFLKTKSLENTNLSLMKTIPAKLEDIEKLEVRINTLTMDAKKSSTKIQELETTRDALDRALQESKQSLDVKAKVMSEMQSQYNAEKKRLEDELCAFRKANEILNGKLKMEEEEKEAKRKEEERKLSSVQLRNNSTSVFTPITCTNSGQKLRVKAGPNRYRFVLDINKNNILAVAYDYHSVYLYSETTKTEELLCTCQYNVQAIGWNQQGTLLAIGGEHMNDTNKTIQIWDFPSRKIIKVLKMKERNQSCRSLDWNGDIIVVGSNNYIYQWNINDRDNDQDSQGNKALLPMYTVPSYCSNWIFAVQWSNCKSKLATITINGDMCICNEELKLVHHNEAHYYNSAPLLQWCPWDNHVIATCCEAYGYLKIWRVHQDITLIKKVKHESGIANIKWIPSKKAIITAHQNNQLVLWEYPSLSIIRTIDGHTNIPFYLVLNADKSALVSKSDNEMIFWKPFS